MTEIKDLEELWKFMKNNIKYGWTNKNHEFRTLDDPRMNKEYFLHSGKETLNDGYGICMDMVQLEKEFCEAKNIEYYTVGFQFKIKDGIYKSKGHIFLVAKENNKYKYFERAFEPCANIVEYDSLDEAISTPIAYYIACFEDLDYRDIDSLVITLNCDYKTGMDTYEIFNVEQNTLNSAYLFIDKIKEIYLQLQDNMNEEISEVKK